MTTSNHNGKTLGCACSQFSEKKGWIKYVPAIISFLLLLVGILSDHFKFAGFSNPYVRLIWYIIAYLPVGLPVLKEAFEMMKLRDVFTEFTLMSVASIGAFAIGEYPEAVAVMLFYSIGELFQDAAVSKATRNIESLLDVRAFEAHVFRNGAVQTIHPEEVKVGEKIQVKAGEKVPLDGVLLSAEGSFNTSALTGESKPKKILQGGQVLSGMLNLDKVIELEVEKVFSDSSLAKILEMVQQATARKAKTELMIRKFAKVYTPLVFLLAVLITFIPFFFVQDYIFPEALYRGLIFLVISCPCALVISIPLSYFGGIGAASRNGILFKGSNYLDKMMKINTLLLDKTGTLTKGVFQVQQVETVDIENNEFLNLVSALEKKSTHPIAKAIVAYFPSEIQESEISEVEEVAGFGIKARLKGQEVLAGNGKWLKQLGISYPAVVDQYVESIVVVAINNKYAGYIVIADELKPDSQQAIQQLRNMGVDKILVLSGDKTSITQKLAQEVGIDEAYGDLLPQDKVAHIEKWKQQPGRHVAFVGDGMNDAPVLATSDVGIAMGALGSDVAIETADVVIQTDQLSKIPTAMRISKATKQIVVQNIILAFAIKIGVMILGAAGLASMWEAVFADVGVALLAVLNATRVLYKSYE